MEIKKIINIEVLFFFILILLLTYCSDSDAKSNKNIERDKNKLIESNISYDDYLNYEKPLNKLIELDKIDKEKILIKIEKLKYKLTITYENKDIKSYPIVNTKILFTFIL